MKNKFITCLLALLTVIGSGISNLAFAYDNLLFVTITAENCTSCQKLKPVLEELEDEYGWQITFFTLDVSSKSKVEEATQLAEDNGFGEFFNNNKGALPRVGILCPDGRIEKTFLGEIRKEVYKEALDELLLNAAWLCSL